MDRTNMKRQLDKDLKHTIQKRNNRLAEFFDKFGLEVEIVGDMETPAVIKGNYCLACYVHNFNLIFTSHYDQGTEVYRIKLQKLQEFDPAPILEWLQTAIHRRIYRIQMKQEPNLFLVGYNFKSKSKSDTDKYPVFGKFTPKVYFTEQYATDIIEIFNLDYCQVV